MMYHLTRTTLEECAELCLGEEWCEFFSWKTESIKSADTAWCYISSDCNLVYSDNNGYDNDSWKYTTYIINPNSVFSQVAAPGECLTSDNNDIGMVLGNNPHTIRVRLTFPDSAPSLRQWILNLGQYTTGAHHWIWDADIVQFGTWGTPGYQLQAVDITQCTDLTTTHSGSVLKLYCNGVFLAETDAQFSIDTSMLTIGTVPFSSDAEAAFAGCISEVAIWSYEKSAEEVAEQIPTDQIRVNIVADDYPSEINWELTDSEGEIVDQAFATNAVGYTLVEVEAGNCYTWSISDSYGDGICCAYGHGSYTIEWMSSDGSVTLIQSGDGQYGDGESFVVCDPKSAITAVELSSNGATVTTNIGNNEFNRIFDSCPVVIYERNGVTHSVYKRTSSTSGFDAFAMFTDTWGNANNVLNVDFEIYNSVEDMQSQKDRWSFCNYNDPDVGYPRDCGMSGSVHNQWFSMPGGRFNARGLVSGAAFKLYERDCPVDTTILEGQWQVEDFTYEDMTGKLRRFNGVVQDGGHFTLKDVAIIEFDDSDVNSLMLGVLTMFSDAPSMFQRTVNLMMECEDDICQTQFPIGQTIDAMDISTFAGLAQGSPTMSQNVMSLAMSPFFDIAFRGAAAEYIYWAMQTRNYLFDNNKSSLDSDHDLSGDSQELQDFLASFDNTDTDLGGGVENTGDMAASWLEWATSGESERLFDLGDTIDALVDFLDNSLGQLTFAIDIDVIGRILSDDQINSGLLPFEVSVANFHIVVDNGDQCTGNIVCAVLVALGEAFPGTTGHEDSVLGCVKFEFVFELDREDWQNA